MDFGFLSDQPDVREYLEKNGVQKTLKELLSFLLNRTDLPYNPYPVFVKRLRTQSQIKYISEESVRKATSFPVVDTDAWLTCPIGTDDIWGLEAVLQCVNPNGARKFKGFVNQLQKSAQEGVQRQAGFDCRVVSALCGVCIYSGSLLHCSMPVEVSMEYLIWGPDKDRAIHIFASNVVSDVVKLINDRHHIAVELHLPGHSTHHLWSPDAIVNQSSTVIQAITAITTNKQTPTLECMFKVAKHSDSYRPGFKRYALNFTWTSDQRRPNERFCCFTELPLDTLHRGVFFSKHQAHAYLSAFMPVSVVEGTRAVGGSRAGSNRISVAMATATATPGRRARPLLREDKDGVDHLSPDQAAEGLREDWKKRVAGRELLSGLFDIAHSILLWVCMDRERFNDVPGTLGEVYRLGRSDSAQLDALVRNGERLEAALDRVGEKPEVLARLWDSIFDFRDQILEFLNPGVPYLDDRCLVSQWPSVGLENDPRTWYTFDSHIVAHDKIKAAMDNVLIHGHRTLSTARRYHKVSGCISYVTQYLTTLQFALLEDTIGQYRLLQAIHKEVAREYPSLTPRRAVTPLKEMPEGDIEKKTGFFRKQKTERNPLNAANESPVYRHGAEDYLPTSTRKLILDVQSATKTSTSPAAIGTESVLLQYCVDARLDETIQDFLSDLLIRPHLPANPYPKLVNRFRGSLFRLELWGDVNRRLVSHLASPSLRQDARGKAYFIHQVSDCSAFGHRSALTFLESRCFKSVEVKARYFACTTCPRRIDYFKIMVDLAVTGFTPLYGRLMPYLHEIELNEHYYVEGSAGRESAVLNTFAEIVLNHLKDLSQKVHHVIVGLVLDKPKVIWSMQDIMDPSRRPDLKSDLADVARRREPIILEAYTVIDWRYVLVQKQFCLHYLSDEGTEYITFFPDNPASLYQNVFPMQDRAANHYSVVLGLDAGDPFSKENAQPALSYIGWKLTECLGRMDLLSAYRWLLIRAFINDNDDSEQVANSWRMFHSVAGQLEYLHILNKDIRRLISLAIMPLQNEIRQCPVDETILGKMVDGFRTKLDDVLTSVPCLNGSDVLRSKLGDIIRSVIQKELKTGAVSLLISEEVVSALEGVSMALEPVMHSAAAEIHTLSKGAQYAVTTVETEEKTKLSRNVTTVGSVRRGSAL